MGEYKVLFFELDEYQETNSLAGLLEPPTGYEFENSEIKDGKIRIVLKLIVSENKE